MSADYLTDSLMNRTSTEQAGPAEPSPEPEPTLLGSMFNAEWLMEQEFPGLEYVVPGLIPEGVTMLVAAPKIGKSWLVLGVAIAAASGGYALGHIQVDQRPVLYLALEDGKRRLQERLVRLEAVQPPACLNFITSTPRGNILGLIAEYVAHHHRNRPVIILDTLGKVMPPAVAGETTYDRDYRVMTALKSICEHYPGTSIVIVHHTRKADGSDFVDAVSGTQGLAGGADTTLLLKRERHERTGTVQITSRDIQEGEYQLQMRDAGTWEIEGQSLDDAAHAAQATKVTDGVGDRQAEVIAAVNKYPEGVSVKSLKEMLTTMAPGDVDTYLKRAHDAGRVHRLHRGTYGPMPSNVLPMH